MAVLHVVLPVRAVKLPERIRVGPNLGLVLRRRKGVVGDTASGSLSLARAAMQAYSESLGDIFVAVIVIREVWKTPVLL